MFTICCTGAHLLPNTGNENILPTTATAQRIPAAASFWILVFFINKVNPFKNRFWENGTQRRFPILSPQDGGQKFPAIRPVEAFWLPLTPEHGFPSLLFSRRRALPLRRRGKISANIRFPSLHYEKNKKTRDTRIQRLRKKSKSDFLRRHYPHQVKGRS